MRFQRVQDSGSHYVIVSVDLTASAVLRVNSAAGIEVVKLLPAASAAQIVAYNDKTIVVDVIKHSSNVPN